MNSFISWVGGKMALRDEILMRFPLIYKLYVEVFGGAGWVLFHKRPDTPEIFNDYNANLVNLYRIDAISKTHAVSLSPGTHNISDYFDATQTGYMSGGKKYVFFAWDLGGGNFSDTITVADQDLRIVAAYREESAPDTAYTITFRTTYGELSKGNLTYGELSQDGKTYTFTAEQTVYEAMAEAFIAINSGLGPVLTADKVYTFIGWLSPIIDLPGRTAQYFAEWDYVIREFTITFDGGEGYHKYSDEQSLEEVFEYGTTFRLPEEGDFVKDDEEYASYILTGWKDENNNIHLPGVQVTVTKDMTYTAVYGVDAKKEYTVLFQYLVADGEWTTITRTYDYDEVIADIPSPPTIITEDYIYTFSGSWQIYGEGIKLDELPSVTADAHYIADYVVSAEDDPGGDAQNQ